MKSDVTILAPLRIEEIALRRGAVDARIERIGMGPKAAIAARDRLSALEQVSSPVVLAGVGGSLDRSLAAGDLVVANAVGSVESGEMIALSDAQVVAELLRSSGLTVHVGSVVSSSVILHGSAARDKAAGFGAICVDMESLWCAPLSANRPFAVVRAILDGPDRDLWSFSTPLSAIKALRALSNAARALSRWVPTSVLTCSPTEVDDF